MPKPVVGTNTGHGHVWERPDGVKARCGGPGLCSTCAADQAELSNSPATPEQPDYLQLAAECLADARKTALNYGLADAADRAQALVNIAHTYQDLGERRRR